MFERYTEQARRVVFYARYEASQLTSGYIEPVHLLLGLLREDGTLRSILSDAAQEQLRAEVEQTFEPAENVAMSVDVPLSRAAKRALECGREAADELGSRPIDTGHLLLGLLRMGESGVSELLMRYGVTAAKVQARLVVPEPPPVEDRLPDQTRVEMCLDQISEDQASQRLPRLPWTRKQALGHLIDWAAAHHEWLGRALVEPIVVAHGYPVAERVEPAGYGEMPWTDLVIGWLSLNDLVSHVASRVPPERLQTPCRIGIEAEKPLAEVIAHYHEYTNDILAEICSLGDVVL